MAIGTVSGINIGTSTISSVVIAFRIVSFVITSTISLPPFKIASSLGRVQALAKLAIISLHVIAATITSVIVTFGIIVSVIAIPELIRKLK